MMLSITAAMNAAREEVSELRRSRDGWSYTEYDHGYRAWTESRATWYAQARAWRSATLAAKAADKLARSAGIEDASLLNRLTEDADHAVNDGANAREAVAAAKRRVLAWLA